MAKNYTEAVEEIAKEHGFSEEYIIDNEIVLEIDCETDDVEDEEWQAYRYSDTGKMVPRDTPIGYETEDDLTSTLTLYDNIEFA